MNTVIGLLGSGGQADEITSYLEDVEVGFRAVDSEYLDPSDHDLIDIRSKEQTRLPVVVAVGAPALKKKMVDTWPGTTYFSLVSERAYVDDGTRVGEGAVVAPGATVTTNVAIGKHALINIGVTVSHDCKIGDFVTISPGVHIAGKVTIGDGVFIGIGASVSNGVTIASGSVIGAGAVVLEDVTEENSIVVGVPAKTVKRNEGWLSEI